MTARGRKPRRLWAPGEVRSALAGPAYRGLLRERGLLAASFWVAFERAAGAPGKTSALLILRRWAEDELKDQRVRATGPVREEVRRLARLGFRAPRIGGLVGLTPPTVRKILRDLGVLP